jgi:hypothetical protein
MHTSSGNAVGVWQRAGWACTHRQQLQVWAGLGWACTSRWQIHVCQHAYLIWKRRRRMATSWAGLHTQTAIIRVGRAGLGQLRPSTMDNSTWPGCARRRALPLTMDSQPGTCPKANAFSVHVLSRTWTARERGKRTLERERGRERDMTY